MTTKEKRSKRCRDWAKGLPEGLLDMIVEWLPVADCVAFSKACKSWEKVVIEASSTANTPSRGCPWLVTNSLEGVSFCSITESKTRFEKFKRNSIQTGILYGAYQDWLIMWTLSVSMWPWLQQVFLLNPFTGKLINLPLRREFGDKMVLTGSPSEENSNFVCLLFTWSSLEFSLWTRGDKSWSKFSSQYEQEPEPLEDAAFCNGHFYILTRNCNINLVDPSLAMKRKGSALPFKPQFFNIDIEMPEIPRKYVFKYMMEHRGGIMLVLRFFEFDGSMKTCAFKIYKLDFERKVWVGLDDLGDQIIFLGKNSSRMYSAKELGIERGNAIYYTNDYKQFPTSGEWYKTKERFGFADWGIYSLEEKSTVGNFCYPPKEANENPVWLFAPLPWYLKGEEQVLDMKG